jgi:hypothetical protein
LSADAGGDQELEEVNAVTQLVLGSGSDSRVIKEELSLEQTQVFSAAWWKLCHAQFHSVEWKLDLRS